MSGPQPSRALVQARINGDAQYNTGKPCHRGHMANKWTCSSHCVECERSKRAENQKKRKARTYGFESYANILEMKDAQKGCCAICAKPFKTPMHTHVDHCHTTKVVRGLLCPPCNHGLGFFCDDPILLRAAAEYIERSRKSKRCA